VDATYLETAIPSTHKPPFEIDEKARFMPLNDLVNLTDSPSGYTVIGGGKTAMDACLWLLDSGVPPDAIRWIRPRDAWLLDREHQQPLERVALLMQGVSLELEAAAQAESVADLFVRLEAAGQLVRLDPEVEPTMYRCATVSRREIAQLRSIENVVRQGHVQRIEADRIVMDEGSIATDTGQVHVDCSAGGLRLSPARPIFEADRISLQQVRTCQPTFNAALLAFLEATRPDDAEKNRLCPPNPYPSTAFDWIVGNAISNRAATAWLADVELSAWMANARLNAVRNMNDYMSDPVMQSAIARWGANIEPGLANLEKFVRAGA